MGVLLGLVLAVGLAQSVFGLLVSASSSTWEVYDSDGNYSGLLVAKREEGQDWQWTYYETNSDPPPQHVEAGSGTASGGPVQYTWTSSHGDSGTVTASDTDPDKATWTNETAGTGGTLRRLQ